MARVSEASTTGPEGGRSAPSPLGRERAADGLSKLMRSDRGRERLPVFVSSKSKFALPGPAAWAAKSYTSDACVRRLLEMTVTGKGLSPLGCLGTTDGELQLTAATSLGLFVLKAAKVPPRESGPACLESGSEGAGLEAV